MGLFEENNSSKALCDTTLTLGLGSDAIPVIGDPDPASDHHQSKIRKSSPIENKCHKSLSLGPITGPFAEMKAEVTVQEDDGVSMDDSSFSNSSLKRERDVISGEDEVDEDLDVGTRRKKLRLTKEQSLVLEDSFKQHSTLNSKQKEQLARRLNLRPRQVEVWFQNRRARNKLKKTEVDCEILRKCYDSLTDENRRLQKELQDLKSMTPPPPSSTAVAPPLYMATTLTMCPSCQRTYGGSSDNSAANNDNSLSIRDSNNQSQYALSQF